jgi:hypothetical protein
VVAAPDRVGLAPDEDTTRLGARGKGHRGARLPASLQGRELLAESAE